MSWTITHKEADPPVQARQSERAMQRGTEWTGVSLLAQSRMQQHRYASHIISPPNSHFLQLHFNLTDATHWTSHYNGFSYDEFYEFIIDFFEADTTAEGQGASAKLLEWWNKYFSTFIPNSPTADGGCSQGGISKVCGYACCRAQLNKTSVARDPATTTPGCPVIKRVLMGFRSPHVRYLMQISSSFNEPSLRNVRTMRPGRSMREYRYQLVRGSI